MREQGVELTAAVPLVLERNVDRTFLRPFVGLKIEDRKHSAGPAIAGTGRYRGVQAGVGLSRSAGTWRDVVPRRALDILAAADWSSERFLSSEFDAWQVSSLANLFVPTPVRHHQLQFLGMYQQRRGGFDHDFFEAVPFGYDDDHRSHQLRLRAAYHFPLAYIEWATPLLPLYLDYLAGTVFYDWGTGWDQGASFARWTDGRRYSTGLRLLLRSGFINPGLLTHLGVALYYHSGDRAVRLESQAGVGRLF
ncbi:MAG: hypothetical protein HY703_11845 [Gemmatimonadetes bacterium]|nr:hypothetical protein [Gemmatimonadota bacterium]